MRCGQRETESRNGTYLWYLEPWISQTTSAWERRCGTCPCTEVALRFPGLPADVDPTVTPCLVSVISTPAQPSPPIRGEDSWAWLHSPALAQIFADGSMSPEGHPVGSRAMEKAGGFPGKKPMSSRFFWATQRYRPITISVTLARALCVGDRCPGDPVPLA